MRIYVDGTALFRSRDGVGQYTHELLKHLLKLDKSNKYVILGFKGDAAKPRLLKGKNVSYEFLPLSRKAYSLSYKILPQPVNRWLKHTPDLVIYPNFVAFPLVNDAPSLVIIHDLVHIEMPEVVEAKNRKFLNRFIPYSIERVGATAVATTEFVAKSMNRHYDISEPIPTLPPGVDPKFGQANEAKIVKIRHQYDLPPGYVLFVGSLQPRKNISGVLAAYSRLPNRLKVIYPLVLAGASGWNDKAINKQISTLTKNGNPIIRTGFVADNDLPALFAGATLFVFPSLYEGFGMPVLEAMSAKTAVVTANTTALPDTAGEAARLVDPYNPMAIEEAMRDLLTHESKRNQLVELGQLNIKRWSWDKSASTLLKLINKTQKQ